MTSPSPLNAGAIIVKCVQTPSLKPYQSRHRSAVAKSCLHFQFASFAFSTELGSVEELFCLVKTETGQGLWKLRMGRIAVRERGLKTLDSTLVAIFALETILSRNKSRKLFCTPSWRMEGAGRRETGVGEHEISLPKS